MGSLLALISDQTQFRCAAMSSSFGQTAQLIGYGTATSAGGAMGGTLIDVDGVGFSGTANTYNGRYWVIQIDGTNEGQRKRIVDDDGAGTLTFEGDGFADQVASGAKYKIVLMPESDIVNVEGGTGGAGFRFIYAAFLQEAADQLNDKRFMAFSTRMTSIGDLWREFAVMAARNCKKRPGPEDSYPAMARVLLRCADLEEELYRDLVAAVN